MRAFDRAANMPWLITEAGLSQILDIAARETTDDLMTQALARKTERTARRSARAGQPVQQARYASVRDGVAILPVVGAVVRYADIFADISGAVSVEALLDDFQMLMADPTIRAVVLTFDSPGGEARGINEFAGAIAQARGQKRIVAYVGEEACSAAYWLASAASEVVVDPTAILGSIGVVITVPDPAAAAGASARKIKFVSRQSPHKQPNAATESGAAQIQGIADDLAAEFVAAVARNRAVSEDTVLDNFGQGGVFVGKHAVSAGLADRLGSFEQVLADLTRTSTARPGAGHSVPQGDSAMDWKGFWGGMFKAAQEEGVQPKARDAAATEIATAIEDAVPQATGTPLAELEALRAQLVAAQNGRIEAEATMFAAELVSGHKALPGETAAIVAAYTRAAQDDAAHPWTAAAEGAATNRVDLVKGLYADRPAHVLTQELITTLVPDGATVLPSASESDDPSKSKPMTAERRRALLMATPEGRAVLAAEAQSAK